MLAPPKFVTKTERILDILERVSFQSVLERFFRVSVDVSNDGVSSVVLRSPMRQLFHVVALAAAASPKDGRMIDQEEWEEVEHLLNDLYGAYYEEPLSLNADVPPAENVAALWALAFGHYHETIRLMRPEQLLDRLKNDYSRYDALFERQLGFTARELADFIVALRATMRAGAVQEMESRKHFLAQLNLAREFAVARGWEPTVWGEVEGRLFHGRLGLEAMRANIFDAGAVNVPRGDVIVKMLSVDVPNEKHRPRPDVECYYYPTQQNPLMQRPLLKVTESQTVCLGYDLLGNAAMTLLDEVLASTKTYPDFAYHRGRRVETQAASALRRILGQEVELHPRVAEKPDGTQEHDIVAIHPDFALVVEVKSASPRETFRDYTKALKRIQGDFAPIQQGCAQALHLRQALLHNDKTVLYREKGRSVAVEVPRKNVVHCICVTSEQMGPMAVDSHKLLKKEPEEPVPWVIAIDDLVECADLFEDRILGFREFLELLVRRQKIRGRAPTTDELEVVGVLMELGDQVDADEHSHFVLPPEATDVFDELYFRKAGNYPQVAEELRERISRWRLTKRHPHDAM